MSSVEDLQLQNSLLVAKAQEDRRARQRAEDELSFARHQLQAREARVAELEERHHDLVRRVASNTSETETAVATAKAQALALATMSAKAASLQQELADAREQLRELTSTQRDGRSATLMEEKLRVIRVRKQRNVARRAFARSREHLERALMEQQDEQHRLEEQLRFQYEMAEAAEARRHGQRERRGSLISFEGVKRSQRGAAGSELPVEEVLQLDTPEVLYLEARMAASSFREQLQPLRGNVVEAAHDIKGLCDTSMKSLLYIFNDREKGKLLSHPKEDFRKEVACILRRTKLTLQGFVNTVNRTMGALLTAEKQVKQQWLQLRFPSEDVGIQANLPMPDDPRLLQQQERIAFLSKRLDEVEAESSRRCIDLETRLEKSHVNVDMLHDQIFGLHDAAFKAMHTVFKHRFHWAQRCPNTFAALDRDKADKTVTYTVKLRNAVEQDAGMLARFAEYFIADDKFGTDQASEKAQQQLEMQQHIAFGTCVRPNRSNSLGRAAAPSKTAQKVEEHLRSEVAATIAAETVQTLAQPLSLADTLKPTSSRRSTAAASGEPLRYASSFSTPTALENARRPFVSLTAPVSPAESPVQQPSPPVVPDSDSDLEPRPPQEKRDAARRAPGRELSGSTSAPPSCASPSLDVPQPLPPLMEDSRRPNTGVVKKKARRASATAVGSRNVPERNPLELQPVGASNLPRTASGSGTCVRQRSQTLTLPGESRRETWAAQQSELWSKRRGSVQAPLPQFKLDVDGPQGLSQVELAIRATAPPQVLTHRAARPNM